MYLDPDIDDKNTIIKDVNIINKYKPNDNKIDLLVKRYQNWQELYKSNSKVSQSLNL